MNPSEIICATSITHQHILGVLNTLLLNRSKKIEGQLKILDAGCGNGKLIIYLHRVLKQIYPTLDIALYGFDVSNHGVQREGFLENTIANLSSQIPETDWRSRIFCIKSGENWDFHDNFFDYIVSNQVLEHVHDKRFFFSNIYKKLLDDGYSIHLAPLTHIIHEGHVDLPYAHRIRSWCGLCAYIKFLSVLRLGKFRKHKKETGISLEKYSEKHADYIYFWTCYATENETIKYAKLSGLRADFRFTAEFYSAKIRNIFRMPVKYVYRFREPSLFDAGVVKILRYISSVTLVCQKRNIY